MPKEPKETAELPEEFKGILRMQKIRSNVEKKFADREARKASPGRFAEHRGKFTFSELDDIQDMNISNAPNVIVSVFSRDWGSDQSVGFLGSQLIDPSSLYNRVIGTSFDHEGSEQTREVFTYLSSQIPNPDLPTLRDASDAELSEWWAKMLLLGGGYKKVQQKRIFEELAYGSASITPEMQEFSDKFVETVKSVTDAIGDISEDDLFWFINFYDTYIKTDDGYKRSGWNMKFRRKRRKFPEGLEDVFDDAQDEATDVWDMGLSINITFKMDSKWDEIGIISTWNDAVDVLDQMPYLQTDDIQVKLIDALEDVLESDNDWNINAGEIPPDGVAALIHFDILKNIDPSTGSTYSKLYGEEAEEEIEYNGLTLQRELVPTTAVQLLATVANGVAPAEFKALMAKVHSVVATSRKGEGLATMDEWLLSIVLLDYSLDDESRLAMHEFIGSDSFSHKAFGGVLRDETSGKIWLQKNGKVRISDHDVVSAALLYTSTYVEPEFVSAEDPSAPREKVIYVGKPRPQIESGGKYKKRRTNGASVRAKTGKTPQADTVELKRERPRPVLFMPGHEELLDLGKNVSSVDLQLVVKAIRENQADGRHPISLMRARGPEGIRYAKMRVNGADSGIRVVFEEAGENTFSIKSIKYRGNAYRDI